MANFHVRPVQDDEELAEIISIDKQLFEEYEPTFELLKKCLKIYPNACSVGRDGDGNFIGYLTFWPIEKDYYERFRAGKIPEFEIYDGLAPDQNFQEDTYWYLDGFVFLEKPFLMRSFLAKALEQTFGALKYTTTVHILAAAYTFDGQNAAEKIPFKPLKHKDNYGHPIYEYTIPVSALIERYT